MKTYCWLILSFALIILPGCNDVARNAELITQAIEHNQEVERQKEFEKQLEERRETKERLENLDTNITVYNEGTNTTSELSIRDGEKNGAGKQYYSDGTLWKEVNYRDGELHGIAKIYYEDGSLKRTVEYDNGKKHGAYTMYFKSGKKKAEVEFNYDLPMPGYFERDYRGNIKNKSIILTREVNELSENNTYKYYFKLEPKGKDVQFYMLEQENEWSPNNTVLNNFKLRNTRDDEGELIINLEPGYEINKTMIIYARFEASTGIEAVVFEKLPIRIRN